MAYDVFISYSSRDKAVADAVCHGLETRGIRCWIAPRDVQPGMEFEVEILRAIEGAKAMTLIFSFKTNQSSHVVREVRCALKHELVVVPFRTEESQPVKQLEYYLSSVHWLDAFSPPLESHIDRLATVLSDIIERSRKVSAATLPDEQSFPGGSISSRRAKFEAAMEEGDRLLESRDWDAAEAAFRRGMAVPGFDEARAALDGIKAAQAGRKKEEMRVAEEKRLAEENRLAEERRLAEEKRIAEGKRAAEEKRLAEERRLAEKKRLAEEKRVAEAKRLADEQRAAEEKRLAEERRLAEKKRLAEEKRLTEAKRLADEQRAAEFKRVAEEKRLAEEKRVAEAKRLADEQRAAEFKRVAEEKRLAEEKRAAEENKRLAEEKRIAEEKRVAEAKRLADEKRAAEEKKRLAEAKPKPPTVSLSRWLRWGLPLAVLGYSVFLLGSNKGTTAKRSLDFDGGIRLEYKMGDPSIAESELSMPRNRMADLEQAKNVFYYRLRNFNLAENAVKILGNDTILVEVPDDMGIEESLNRTGVLTLREVMEEPFDENNISVEAKKLFLKKRCVVEGKVKFLYYRLGPPLLLASDIDYYKTKAMSYSPTSDDPTFRHTVRLCVVPSARQKLRSITTKLYKKDVAICVDNDIYTVAAVMSKDIENH